MHVPRTLRLLAIALVAALVAVAFVPAVATSHLGEPGLAFRSQPADEAPVPDRPEPVAGITGTAITATMIAVLPPEVAEELAHTELGRARDGVHPRVERPPAG